MICDKCGYWLTAFTIKDCPGCKRVRILEEKLTVSELAVQFCDPIVDELNVTIRQQAARIRELEEKLAVSNLTLELSDPIDEQLKSRIRELEQALPDAFRLRVIAGACNELRQHTAEDSLLKMADRIESVMTKPPSEK